MTILHDKCINAMRAMPEASVDAIVTDPPYLIGFMGKAFDSQHKTFVERKSRRRADSFEAVHGNHNPENSADQQRTRLAEGHRAQAWHEAWATEALRVLKPGGHLLAFGGTRTYHRLTCAIEDAGFEVRDEVLSIFEATEAGQQFLASLSPDQLKALDRLGGGPLAWLYGQGFPKSRDVSKAIDKAAGAKREVVGERVYAEGHVQRSNGSDLGRMNDDAWTPTDGRDVTAPATPDAEYWQGWGTALKPAHEPIVLARKPLAGTVARNVLAHGTGALNVDGCRIEGGERPVMVRTDTIVGANSMSGESTGATGNGEMTNVGRWPANVVLSHSEQCVETGTRKIKAPGWRDTDVAANTENRSIGRFEQDYTGRHYADPDGTETITAWECVPDCPVRLLDEQTGELHSQDPRTRDSQSPRSGLIGFADSGLHYADKGGASRFFYCAKASTRERNAGLEMFGERNAHPTVKPVALMRWLVRLVTPPGGTVLDPFCGSGSTGIACVHEGFKFIGVEQDADSVATARARIAHWG